MIETELLKLLRCKDCEHYDLKKRFCAERGEKVDTLSICDAWEKRGTKKRDERLGKK